MSRDAPRAPLTCVVVSRGSRIRRWEEQCIRLATDAGVAVTVAGVRTHSEAEGREDAGAGRFARALLGNSAAMAWCDLVTDGDILQRQEADDSFEQRAIDFLTARAPDFLLILEGVDEDFAERLARTARWGCWSYRFGPALTGDPAAAALDASQSGRATIGAALLTLGAGGAGGHVLGDGHVTTFPARPARTLDQICFAATPWLRSACLAVADAGSVERAAPGPVRSAPTQPDPLSPARLALGILTGAARTQAHYRLFRQQWNVGVVPAPIHVVAGLEGADAQAAALAATRWMPEEKGRFFADPFGYPAADGTMRIYFELLDWKTGRGTIAARTFDGARFSPAETVLDRPTHLSYPFVRRIGGQWHFIPEHAEARDVSAYAADGEGAVDNPTPLLRGAGLLDCTFLDWEGRIWMFAVEERHAGNAELFLFHSEDIAGPWQPHPLNPIKTDVRNARPAGTPFVYQGKLYRPAQDCSRHYGQATVIHEIVTLNERAYVERPVARVEPPSGSRYDFGLHTVSSLGEMTLIDGARKAFRWTT